MKGWRRREEDDLLLLEHGCGIDMDYRGAEELYDLMNEKRNGSVGAGWFGEAVMGYVSWG